MPHCLLAKTALPPQEHSEAYGLMGQLYHAYQLLDAAAVYYHNALHLTPESFAWRYALADVLRQQGKITDAIGAWVTLSAGGMQQRRQVMPTRSYLSQVELPLTFGLGMVDRVDSIRIDWPDGAVDEVRGVQVDTMVMVEQREVFSFQRSDEATLLTPHPSTEKTASLRSQ